MTTAQILRTARTLMLEHHGPKCADRPFWEQTAALLGDAERRAAMLAEVQGVDVVDSPLIRPLAIANAYLDLTATKRTKEHIHG